MGVFTKSDGLSPKSNGRKSSPQSQSGTDTKLVSNVVLVSRLGKIPVFLGSSNSYNNLKTRIESEVNTFIRDPEQYRYAAIYSMREVFGAVGVLLLFFGFFILYKWLRNAITIWQELRNAAKKRHNSVGK